MLYVLPTALAVLFLRLQEQEKLVCSRLPLSPAEYLCLVKSSWWYGVCGTYQSFQKVISDMTSGLATRKSELDGIPDTREFQAVYNPSKAHNGLKRCVNAMIAQQAFAGVRRVEMVSCLGVVGLHVAGLCACVVVAVVGLCVGHLALLSFSLMHQPWCLPGAHPKCCFCVVPLYFRGHLPLLPRGGG